MLGGLAVAATAVLLRLPFVGVPLTADEGGYAEIARLWVRGANLYRSDWVDRPQGLLLAFRAALAVGATTTVDLRLAAALTGCALGLLVLWIGALTLGPRAGFVAAALATVACASPWIEGFTLAGELLAAVVAAAAIATLLKAESSGRLSLIFVAGLLAGCALMVKQSGFDAAGAGILLLVLPRTRRAAARTGTFTVGVVVPVVLAAGLSGNVTAWYHAVVGDGVGGWEARAPAGSLVRLALALGPTLMLAALGWRRSHPLLRAWAALAVLGVCAGGAFRPHYFLQLAAPASLLAAAGLARLGHVRGRIALVGAIAFAVAVAAPLWFRSGTAQARTLWPSDRHLRTDAAVARYVRLHTSASASIYVVWAAADLYYLADRRPALRYLWLRNMQTITGAVTDADRLLAQRVPALVVVEQPLSIVDGTGRTTRLLRRDYRPVATIGGVTILGRRGR